MVRRCVRWDQARAGGLNQVAAQVRRRWRMNTRVRRRTYCVDVADMRLLGAMPLGQRTQEHRPDIRRVRLSSHGRGALPEVCSGAAAMPRRTAGPSPRQGSGRFPKKNANVSSSLLSGRSTHDSASCGLHHDVGSLCVAVHEPAPRGCNRKRCQSRQPGKQPASLRVCEPTVGCIGSHHFAWVRERSGWRQRDVGVIRVDRMRPMQLASKLTPDVGDRRGWKRQ